MKHAAKSTQRSKEHGESTKSSWAVSTPNARSVKISVTDR